MCEHRWTPKFSRNRGQPDSDDGVEVPRSAHARSLMLAPLVNQLIIRTRNFPVRKKPESTTVKKSSSANQQNQQQRVFAAAAAAAQILERIVVEARASVAFRSESERVRNERDGR